MGTIYGFLARRYMHGLMLALAVVCGIVFATSFVQNIGSAPTVLDALDASFLHFLELFPMFLPLTVFIGTLLTFYKLLMASELVIIQSAGWSTYQIMRPMMLATVIVGIITVTVINPLSTQYRSTNLRSSKIDRIDGAVWLHEKQNGGSLIIRSADMKNAGGNGLAFSDATVIRQNEKYQIIERTIAENITLADGKLSARNALVLDSKGIEQKRDWTAATGLAPENIVRQYMKPNMVSFWRLPELIRNLRGMGIPVGAHMLQFLSLLFLPLVSLSMAVLGVVFSQTRRRRGFSFVRQFGLGIITCFIVYFIIQIFNAIGLSGAIPPLFAVFLPPAIVLFFAATSIIKTETL
jgi:lipopolysaccharide export system permease protein